MAMQPLAQEPADQESRSRIVVIMNRVGVFFEASWALIITALLGLICLAAFGAPILSYAGLDVIAKPLFFTLSRICGQIPSHSFYIAGHQVGLCVHCLAIYSAMFAGGLLFRCFSNVELVESQALLREAAAEFVAVEHHPVADGRRIGVHGRRDGALFDAH